MQKTLYGRSRWSIGTIVLLVSFVALLAGYSLAEALQISPFKWVLNVEGASESVQATFSMAIAGTLTGGEAKLSFGDELIAETTTMRYCYIDNNLLISFNKTELFNNPAVIAAAGTTVTATVEGSCTTIDADGNTKTYDFSGTDQVEIVAPGKTGERSK